MRRFALAAVALLALAGCGNAREATPAPSGARAFAAAASPSCPSPSPSPGAKTVSAARLLAWHDCRLSRLEASTQTPDEATPSPSPSATPSPSASSTPTASPIPTPTGTTAPVGGCLPNPSACGFPDATNTGVPSGTQLLKVDATNPVDCMKGCGLNGRGWYWDRTFIRVTSPDAVVANISTTGSLYIINAPRTVVRNTRVTCSSADCIAVQVRGDAPGSTDVTITDSQITDTVGGASAGIFNTGAKNMTLTRLDIGGFGGGVQTGSYGWSLTDSYIHDVSIENGSHGNGVQSSGGGGATITHNTIINPHAYTDAVMLTNDFGTPQRDDTVTGNLLAGGGFTIYAGDTGSGGQCGSGCQNITVTDNRIIPGTFGGITAVPRGATVARNVHDTTGKPVTP